jgi:hypothetical protein
MSILVNELDKALDVKVADVTCEVIMRVPVGFLVDPYQAFFSE